MGILQQIRFYFKPIDINEKRFWLEGLFWFVIIGFTYHNYHFIVKLAASRNLNYANLFQTSIDAKIPFSIIFSPAYLGAYLLPESYGLIILLIPAYRSLANLRCTGKATMLLLISSYIFYVTLPTYISVAPYFHLVPRNSDLDRMVDWIFSFQSPWNAFPSLHSGIGWLSFRVFGQFDYRFKPFFFLYYILVILGCLTLKYHYICDIFAGALLAELCYRYSFREYSRLTVRAVA